MKRVFNPTLGHIFGGAMLSIAVSEMVMNASDYEAAESGVVFSYAAPAVVAFCVICIDQMIKRVSFDRVFTRKNSIYWSILITFICALASIAFVIKSYSVSVSYLVAMGTAIIILTDIVERIANREKE